MSHSHDKVRNVVDIQVKETNNHTAMDICSVNLSANAMPAPQNDVKEWTDPAFKISLPSFSRRTEYNPHLLKYSCKIKCRRHFQEYTQIFHFSGEVAAVLSVLSFVISSSNRFL